MMLALSNHRLLLFVCLLLALPSPRRVANGRGGRAGAGLVRFSRANQAHAPAMSSGPCPRARGSRGLPAVSASKCRPCQPPCPTAAFLSSLGRDPSSPGLRRRRRRSSSSSSGPEAASRQRESIRIQHITSACKGLTRSFGLAARSTPDHDSAQLTCASLSSQSGTWWSLKNRPSANNTGVPGFWTKKILCAWTLEQSDAPPVPARTLGELCRTTKRRRKCWALSSTVSGCVCNFRGPPAVVETGEA